MITRKDIGRRVIVNGVVPDTKEKINNKVGTIKYIDTDELSIEFFGAAPISIQFDEYDSRFHDCNGYCTYGYGYCVSEDMITFERRNTGIRIETKKVVDSAGILCREILKIKALPKNKLPDIYLLSDGPKVWKSGFDLYLENIKTTIHSNCKLIQGERYSEEYIQKCLEHCRAAGDNLMECNRELAEKKAAWNGTETFII